MFRGMFQKWPGAGMDVRVLCLSVSELYIMSPFLSCCLKSCHFLPCQRSLPTLQKKKKKKEKCSFNPSFVLILGIFRTVGGLGELLWDRDTGLCHLLLKVTLFHPCSLLRMGEKSKLNSWRRGKRSQVNVELLERAGVTSGVK